MMFKKLGVQAYTFRDAYMGENADEKTLEAAFKNAEGAGV